MNLVGPRVGHEFYDIVHVGTIRKTSNVEGKENIDQINYDERRDAKAYQTLALKKFFGLKLACVQINSGYWACPSVNRLR